MLLVVSTSGTNASSPCASRWQEDIKILEGSLDNQERFILIFTIDEDDDWKDFEAWKKANPNFGVSVAEKYLYKKYREAMTVVEKQNINLCKHLNIWTNAAVGWINMAKWDACAVPDMKIEDFAGCDCWVGVDLASKVDLAAMMFLFRVPQDHPFAAFVRNDYILFGKYYMPEETVEQPENAHYRAWRDKGILTVTPGARTDFSYLEDDLKIMAGKRDLVVNTFRWTDENGEYEGDVLDAIPDGPTYLIQDLVYDPREAEYLMQNIRTWASFECIEMTQSATYMSEPMQEFEALYRSGKLKHTGCPMLKWQASNVIRKNAANKLFFPAKQRPENKIDGIVAAIMALSRAMTHEDADKPGDISGFLERSVCI